MAAVGVEGAIGLTVTLVEESVLGGIARGHLGRWGRLGQGEVGRGVGF